MAEPCIFCEIIEGKKPGDFVYQGDSVVAFKDKNPHAPVKAYRALHTLWEEATGDDTAEKAGFDNKGKCLKCGSKVSFADVTDTLVFIGEEITKRYDGDITNRNCVKCTYPKQYVEYEHYDEPGLPDGGGPEC